MREISFCGGSDDLVEISGAPGADEFDPNRCDGEWNVLEYQSGNSRWSGAWDIVSGEERLRVHAVYDGTWCFAPAMASEDIPLPSWEVRIGTSGDCSYSVELVVSAPDDATISCVYPNVDS